MTRRAALHVTLVAALLAAGCLINPPISIGQRESIVGQGKVIAITNTSDKFLHEVLVTIESPDGEVKTFSTATLEPHESLSVGWLKLEGWPIPDGAEVSVGCKGYLADAGPYRVQP